MQSNGERSEASQPTEQNKTRMKMFDVYEWKLDEGDWLPEYDYWKNYRSTEIR